MWSSTVGLVNGKHRYLTAETFGFKINSNGQMLKKRQQWTIEPFPENLGPDGSISSAASVSSQAPNIVAPPTTTAQQHQQQTTDATDPTTTCILTTFATNGNISSASLSSIKSSASNGSSHSQEGMEGCGEEHENVAIKSHLNKYLAVDSFGNVTCDSEEKTENARFTITICSMSQGRSKDEHIFWAFKNVERGYYLGTTEDGMICCDAKMPKSRAELWHLHLIPARGASFFAIKSLGRKRFARFVGADNPHQAAGAQIQLDATLTWGPETLFQFKYYEGGRYSLLTSDCMYLTNEGKCIQWAPSTSTSTMTTDETISVQQQQQQQLPPPECLFTLEYHSGFLAFRDSFCHYLAAAGRSSILRSRSIGVSRDELFVFEPAPIQVSLKATFNNRWVSIKQGVDLSANQTDSPSSKFETFQLTYHKQTQLWSIMSHECNFWTLSTNSSTISVCRPGDYEGLTRGQFKLVWSETDATCSLKYIDHTSKQERWIAARKSGQLFVAAGGGSQEPVKFIIRFQNRRLLNLRPVDGSGFVGLKANSGNCKQLEANKTMPDSIAIEYSELPNNNNNNSNGIVEGGAIKGAHGNDLEQQQPQTINVFNVRLNSTKMGQSIMDRFSGTKSANGSDLQQENGIAQQQQTTTTTTTTSSINSDQATTKELDLGIDDNNNNCVTAQNDDLMEDKVESAAAPSVASIINSFSKTKIQSSNGAARPINSTPAPSQQANNRANSSVFKLASSFSAANNGGSNGVVGGSKELDSNDATSDTASVITSCSTASASSTSQGCALTINQQEGKSHQDQLVAQLECCYLKTISNDRYLVVGDNESSVICDATNKACAQPWILELRSHNSIAIRASDTHAYIQLGTNGTISLSRCEPKDASLWEF